MLKQRFFTAIFLAPIVVSCILFAPPVVFMVMMTAVYGLCAWEWAGLTTLRFRWIVFVCLVAGLAASFWLLGPIEENILAPFDPELLGLMGFSALWWLIALFIVLSYPKIPHIWHNMLFKVFAGLMVLVPFYYVFCLLRFAEIYPQGIHGRWVLLYAIGLVWFADTGAYFAGRWFGRRKLVPHVSPGKTWAGLLGGVFSAMVLAVAFTSVMGLDVEHTLLWLLSSVLAVFASVLGDLTESLFKREAGVKDSGRLLPGHGGILDRVDSLTAALPIFFLLMLLMSYRS